MGSDPSAAATGTFYGAVALVVIALVPFLRDWVAVFRAFLEHRWKTPPAPPAEPDAPAPDTDPVEIGSDQPDRPDIVWLERRIKTLELRLSGCEKQGERYVGEIEQLQGEIEFLVGQLQETVQERDEALAREARLRREQGRR